MGFTGDQMLYGSYGGDEGKPARAGEILFFGFYHIDVCKQSPVIIYYRSNTPLRAEPVAQYYLPTKEHTIFF